MFGLHISPDELRKMNRKQYYDTQRWLRATRRLMMFHMKQNIKAINEAAEGLAIYGTAVWKTTT